MKRKWGWRKQQSDQRDYRYRAIRLDRMALEELPPSVDLRDKCPVVYDQGELGSCTAQAIAAAYEVEIKQETELESPLLSRLFIYYNERALEGTTDYDAGATIRDGIKTIAKDGVCLESLWPYDISQYTVSPTDEAYTEAQNHQAIEYATLSADTVNIRNIKLALADGHGVVFGFTVYESFESEDLARTGTMPMPSWSERVLGGHAVLAVGYDDASQHLLVRNSWGSSWGQEGYFWMPYSYLQSLASDFWIIQDVE